MVFVGKKIIIECGVDTTGCNFDLLNECYVFPPNDPRITLILLQGYELRKGPWEGADWIV